MTPYLSRKIRLVSFLALFFVLFQHAINFTGYIDPSRLFGNIRNWDAYLQYFLGYGIPRFSVPLFFLLSGYLFYRNFSFSKLLKKYRSRFRSLLVPYVLWNIIGILVIAVLQSIPGISAYLTSFYTGNVLHRTIATYISMIVNHGVSFHLWFVYDLMIYTICAPLIYLLVKTFSWFLVIPLFVCWFLRIHIPIPFVSWDSAGVFYLIGVCIAVYGKDHQMFHGRLLPIVTVSIWISSMLIKTLAAFQYVSIPFLTLAELDNLTVLSGMIAVWLWYDRVPSLQTSELWMTLSASTFFVYAAHEPLLDLIKYVFVGLFRNHSWSTFPLFVIIPFVVFALCFYIALICKKLLPGLYLLLSGGR